MNSVVRPSVIVMLVSGAFAALPASTMHGLMATAASTLFESTPFILAGIALGAIARDRASFAALLGCGCGTGPSARSVPAAVATVLVFGPVIAIARLSAGWIAAWLLRGRKSNDAHSCRSYLSDMRTMLPAALGAAVAMHALAEVDATHLAPELQVIGGAVLAFVSAPCALGAVAVAGALHARSAAAAAGFLAIAGIGDVRALLALRAARSNLEHATHDALAYAMAAAALAIVAVHGGASVVHPLFVMPLAACATFCGFAAIHFRTQSNWRERIAPGIMLAGALITAPVPEYRATETTLNDLFPGERLTFTGVLVRQGRNEAVVRYAITCCRADASPIVIRLSRPVSATPGTWVTVDGPVVRESQLLQLAPDRVVRIPAPADPFVYR